MITSNATNSVIVDIECTFQRNGPKTNPSPYHKDNKLVSVGCKDLSTSKDDYLFFCHKEKWDNTYLEHTWLQNTLDSADLVIGHNLKFDMSWLFECGFTYSGKYWDTMIFEYVIAKGLKPTLSLGALCEKYMLTLKKDIFKEYMKQGLNTDEMPMSDLREYGLGDIQSTADLYARQQHLIATDPEVQSMMPAILLMMEELPVLIQMERDGIHISRTCLSEVEKEYREESAKLEAIMNDMVVEVMGHRPINLNSPEHLSWIIYSRKVNDKPLWAEIFNIGMELRGSVMKPKYPPRLTDSKLYKIVRENTTVLKRQDAEHCTHCESGTIQKVKKNGSDFKNRTKCSHCQGKGFTYVDRSETAGFKLRPLGSIFATASGFATDKSTIEALCNASTTSEKAKTFLKCLSRYNAIQTYLSTFVEGIQKNTHDDSILHTSFNQCITATGRLSSSNPNFQNLPRGKTFPVRKAITSRFEEGFILEADFAGLEFRTAAMLSKCPIALRDILNGEDIHAFTAKVLTDAGQPTDRQGAKAHTFKPLFGGLSGTYAEVTYYKAFLEKYYGIKQWQDKLVDSAINYKQIQSPSGRIYSFPNAKRLSAERVVGRTQIVNYPVQGFATGDLVWCVIIHLFNRMQELAVRSKLILQVHDSIVADVHPEEKDLMIELFKQSFNKANQLLKDRFNFDTEVPIGYEMAIGNNLMEKEKIA